MKEPASDLATLVLAVVIAALARVDGALGLVLSYAGAWAIVNVARVVGWPPAIEAPRRVIAVVVALVLVVPLRDLAARAAGIAEHEAIASPLEHLADRAALEADPAIAPGLVSADRPQTFFVRASGAHVRVRLGEGVAWIDAEGLGHGVFRVDYDPRAHGTLDAAAHATRATIEVDGAASERPMLAITPLAHPRWIRTSPDRQRACVPSEETDEVLVVVGAHEERIATLDGPTDCEIHDDGSLLVSHRFSPALLAIDAQGARTTLAMPTRGAVGVVTLGERPCVVGHGEVRCAGAAPLAIEGTPIRIERVAPAGALVATLGPARLLRVDLANDALVLTSSRLLAAPAAHLAADDAGGVWAAAADFAPDGHAGLGNHFVQDRLLCFDATTLALRQDHLTAWRSERQDHAGDVDRGTSPIGVSVTPRGTTWVAFAGADELEELGGDLAEPRVIDTAALGLSAPHSVVELANRTLVVSSPSSGLVAVLDASGELVRAIPLAPSDHELLASDPSALQVRYGERAFYEATRSGVSCQSCHLHGGTDGATHNIGGRIAAPTLDVRGLVGTSPYLRDGSYPRLRDLLEVAVTEYRGYRESAGDRGATMEAWMRTLPPPPTFHERDAGLEREGLDVFFRAGCPTCHAPPAFTSLGLHATEAVFPHAPARTEGRLLDVPSLRSVGVSAPHLYDGRAQSLRPLFLDHNEGDRHGHTAALDAHALDALVAFLESL